MEDVKKIFKSIMASERKKAFLSLAFWIIFFIIVFALIGSRPDEIPTVDKKNNNNVVLTDSSLENFEKMSNFEFSYLIEITNNNITNNYKIEGTYYNNKYYLTINNKEYYIMDNTLYVVDDISKKLSTVIINEPNSIFAYMDIRLLTKESLHTFIKSSTEKSKTTYKDGSVESHHTYTSYDEKTIKFKISEYGNIINAIEMDFSNYFNVGQRFTISASYKNINNISTYAKNYDNYEIIKEED